VLDLHAAYLGSKVEWSQACAQRFILIPADVPHFLATREGPVIVQASGRGIFRTNYLEK
jgi:hypothetical protein